MSKVLSCKTGDTATAIKEIAKTVSTGGIIIFPTDTVYGMGCNPYDEIAVKRIYELKQREKQKELPVLGFSKKDIEGIAQFNDKAQKIAKRYWPGKITLVLKLKDTRLEESLGITRKIAVRIPNNACALSILEKCRLLVGTSANISGAKPFVDPKDCLDSGIDVGSSDYKEKEKTYDIFVDGGVIQSNGESSTIVDCTTDQIVILREGAIKLQELENILL